MPVSKAYFSQIYGKWGVKNLYKKRLIGRPKFIDVRKTENGLVIVNTDSSKTINYSGFKLKAYETLSTLTRFGPFNEHSIAFDYNYEQAQSERLIESNNLAAAINNSGKGIFTRWQSEAGNTYKMILPNRYRSFVKVVTDGELYLTEDNPDILLEDFLNNYNDLSNLIPADWESEKLISNSKLGIKFKNPEYSFRINFKCNANAYGNKLFTEVKFLKNDVFMTEYNHRSCVLNPNDFSSREEIDNALSKSFNKVHKLESNYLKDTIHFGFTFEKKNTAYTFLDRSSKLRSLQKYYRIIYDVHKDRILVQGRNKARLINFNEEEQCSAFEATGTFNKKGVFKGYDGETWGLFNYLGDTIITGFRDLKENNLGGYFAKSFSSDFGILNANGDSILDYKYKIVKDYNSHNLAILRTAGKSIVFDRNAKEIFQSKKRLLRVIEDKYVIYRKGKTNRIYSLKTGKKLKIPKANKILDITDSLVSFSNKNVKFIFSLKTKKKIYGRNILRTFDKSGFAVKSKQENIILINTNLEEVMNLEKRQYDDLNGWLRVLPYGKEKHIYINNKGNVLNINSNYYLTNPFDNGLATFKDENSGMIGVINELGEIVIEPIYKKIKPYSNKEFVVSTKNGTGVIDINSNWIFKDVYGSINIIQDESKVYYSISPKTFSGLNYDQGTNAPTVQNYTIQVPPIYDKINFINQEIAQIKTYEGKVGYITFNSFNYRVIWDLNK